MPFLRQIVNGAGNALSNRAANAMRKQDKHKDKKDASGAIISLPSARVLETYNINNNDNLFWITLTPKFIHNPRISADTLNQTKKIDIPSPEILESFKILYSDETYSQSHSHSWEKSLGQTKLDELSKAINGGLGRMSMMAGDNKKEYKGGDADGSSTSANIDKDVSFADGITSSMVKGLTNFSTRDQYFSASTLDYYAGSAVVPIEVKFNLIAFDNPITDIILPIKRIVSMTYPQVVTITGQKEISTAFVDIMNKSNQSISDTIIDNAILAKKSQDAAKSGTDAKKNALAEKLHMHYGNPPFLWDINLSNDLQTMKSAFCKSVNVQYFGPWMGKPDKTTAFQGLFGNLEETMGSGLFGKLLNPSSFNKLLNKGDPNGKGGYPSYATVSMVFEPAVSQTADDVLALDSTDVSATEIGSPSGLENGINKLMGNGKNSIGSMKNKIVQKVNKFGNEIRN
jgi:hypothetical protein